MKRFYTQTEILGEAIRNKKYLENESLAREHLSMAYRFPSDWNYGNAIHKAYTLIGLKYLVEGDIPKAESFLLKSSPKIASPQLRSFGPNTALLEGLLRKGRKKASIKFLDKVEKFWNDKHATESLKKWRLQILENDIPDFGANNHY